MELAAFRPRPSHYCGAIRALAVTACALAGGASCGDITTVTARASSGRGKSAAAVPVDHWGWPQSGCEWQRRGKCGEAEQNTLILVVDESNSMAEPMRPGTPLDKLAATQQAAMVMMTVVPPSLQVGAVRFSDDARTALAINTGWSAQRIGRSLHPSSALRGDTDLAAGLGYAYDTLRAIDGNRVVVIISDGGAATPKANTDQLRGDCIRVHSLFVGTDKDDSVSVLRQLAPAFGEPGELQYRCMQLMGCHFELRTLESLTLALQDIVLEMTPVSCVSQASTAAP